MGTTYILASRKGGAIYVGVTSDLEKRVKEHISGSQEGHTKKYGIHMVVWFQEFQHIEEAIQQEKKIKGRSRSKKIALIESENKERNDLYGR